MSKVHPAFGNLVVEEHDTHVALLLRVDHDGRARFTYREIGLVAGLLAGLKPPAEKPAADDLDDDDRALLG